MAHHTVWHIILKDDPKAKPDESPFDFLPLPAGTELDPRSSFMTLNEMRKMDGRGPFPHPDADTMAHMVMISKWWKLAVDANKVF